MLLLDGAYDQPSAHAVCSLLGGALAEPKDDEMAAAVATLMSDAVWSIRNANQAGRLRPAFGSSVGATNWTGIEAWIDLTGQGKPRL